MDSAKFINIGYGNLVNSNRVIAIVRPESAPVKRLVSEAKAKGLIIDATYGRKTRSVIVMDDGHIILTSSLPETTGARLNTEN